MPIKAKFAAAALPKVEVKREEALALSSKARCAAGKASSAPAARQAYATNGECPAMALSQAYGRGRFAQRALMMQVQP